LQGNGFAVSGVANAKMSFSNVCFTNNEFIGSGVVVVEGSIDDFSSSNVSGTVDPNLNCPYASIGFSSCVEYDSDTCFAPDPYVPVTDPLVSAPVENADASIEDNTGTSDCFSIRTKVSLVLLLVSVVLAL
jgi:hypothetical protein